MPPARDEFRRYLVLLTVVVALTGAAMWLYPGGTPLDPHTVGYRFTQNFLSDLGMTVAYNGTSNRLGASCFIVALCTLVAASARVLWMVLRAYALSPVARRFTKAAGALAFVVCTAFVGVAATPENSAMPLHVSFTLFAFRVLPFVALAVSLATIKEPTLPRRVSVGWLGLTVTLTAYALLLGWYPDLRTQAVLMVQVIAQKAISAVIIAVLTWQFAILESRATPKIVTSPIA